MKISMSQFAVIRDVGLAPTAEVQVIAAWLKEPRKVFEVKRLLAAAGLDPRQVGHVMTELAQTTTREKS